MDLPRQATIFRRKQQTSGASAKDQSVTRRGSIEAIWALWRGKSMRWGNRQWAIGNRKIGALKLGVGQSAFYCRLPIADCRLPHFPNP
jgi:hypothetical protein